MSHCRQNYRCGLVGCSTKDVFNNNKDTVSSYPRSLW